MANVNMLYDKYSQEEYLCAKLKPLGELLCGYCNQPYEPITYESHTQNGCEVIMTVCKCCGEVSFPYQED